MIIMHDAAHVFLRIASPKIGHLSLNLFAYQLQLTSFSHHVP